MRFKLRGNILKYILALAAVAGIAAGFFIPGEEHGPAFWFSHLFGFFALLGFIGCAAIVIVAKWLGHYWLQRKEDYYD